MTKKLDAVINWLCGTGEFPLFKAEDMPQIPQIKFSKEQEQRWHDKAVENFEQSDEGDPDEKIADKYQNISPDDDVFQPEDENDLCVSKEEEEAITQ